MSDDVRGVLRLVAELGADFTESLPLAHGQRAAR
jgi:hypothetical protein